MNTGSAIPKLLCFVTTQKMMSLSPRNSPTSIVTPALRFIQGDQGQGRGAMKQCLRENLPKPYGEIKNATRGITWDCPDKPEQPGGRPGKRMKTILIPWADLGCHCLFLLITLPI